MGTRPSEPRTLRELLEVPRGTRDRRGRGVRGPLFPPGIPARKTSSNLFDKAAVTAFADLDADWHDQLTELDVAVDDIPRMLPKDMATIQWPDEVTADGPVPLARLIPAGIDARGNPTRAKIILFRRPIELRSSDDEELPEILRGC